MLWTDGVGNTEKALGLKHIELKAICDKFEIPRPSSGYWTSLKLGKPVERTELTPNNNDTVVINTSDYITKKKMPKQPIVIVKSTIDTEGKYQTRELPLSTQDINPLYRVPDVLYAKDPLILDTKAKLRERNFRDTNPWNVKNPFKCKADKWLSMSVSQEQEDRAIRIYATIIRAAKAKGYELLIEKEESRYYPECTTYIVIRGHKIRTFLKEIHKCTKNDDGTINRYKTVGSGELKFECDEYEQHHRSSFTRCVAQDTKHSKIEDKIEHIIEVLEKVADNRDERARQRELEEERRKQEEEKRRLEEEERKRLQALQDEEFRRVQDLIFNAERLKLSKTIREYINELQLRIQECGVSDDEIEWMKKKADFIDPFVNCSDELLTEEHIDKLLNPEIIMTDKSKTSYGFFHSEPQYSYWRIKNLWSK
jgi:hypothetical protein